VDPASASSSTPCAGHAPAAPERRRDIFGAFATSSGARRDAAIKLRNGDRLIVTDDEGYSLIWAIVGPRRFDYVSSFGWNHKYYWSSAIATDG
jgi:hypothetical protein